MNLARDRNEDGAGPTRQLTRFACSLAYADLDDRTRHSARRHILDTLGACVAGSRQAVTEMAEAVMADIVPAGNIPVPGRRRRFDALSAAYLAGASIHGLELDDGYRAGSVHPGAVVLPAALAIGYGLGIDGEAMITAVAVGYEVAARIAEAAHPHTRWRGFHATSTAGVFAAAAAVGSLRGLGEEAMENAFGLAASSASGLFAFIHGGGDVKRLHPGHAAREGMLAALLAERGMAGPSGVLESEDGYFHAFAGGDAGGRDYSALDLFAGWRAFAITECYIKPHACCRHIHPALDGMLDILRDQNLEPGMVRKVEVGTYRMAAAHAETGWRDMASAQLSFPFVMATGLHRRAVRLEHFSEARRNDARVTADCAKIRVFVDEGLDAEYPRLRPAKVTVVTTGGQSFRRRVDEAYGSPANPMDDEALGAKYLDLVGGVLGPERAEETLALLWRLEELASVTALGDALSG